MQAGIFGERDDLLKEAEKRLREEPSKYFQHIYGKEEVGGTSVLYLSAVPFEQLGLPANLPTDPMPLLTYRVLSKIPNLVTLGGLLLGGIWWITNRREEVAKAEKKEKSGVRCQVSVGNCADRSDQLIELTNWTQDQLTTDTPC